MATNVRDLNEGMAEQLAVIAGVPLAEAVDEAKKAAPKKGKKPAEPVACEGDGCDDAEDDDAEDEYEGVDPLEAPHMTEQLVVRLEHLDLAAAPDEALVRLVEALAEKTFDEGTALGRRCLALAEALRAEIAGRDLDEALFTRVKAFKKGSMAKKIIKRAAAGYHQEGGKIKRVAAARAARTARIKKRWARSGAGAKAAKRAERMAARRGESVGESVLARELAGLLAEGQAGTQSDRAEVLGLLESCFDLLSDEIMDGAVDQVFEAAMAPLTAGYQAGRLDEAVMDEDAFLAEITPATQLIARTMDKLDRGLAGNA